MENHYKDGNWQYPEFAQPEDIFLEIIGQIDSPYFGVQCSTPPMRWSAASIRCRFLEKIKTRVVTMRTASDRYLGKPEAQPSRVEASRWHDRLLSPSCFTAKPAKA